MEFFITGDSSPAFRRLAYLLTFTVILNSSQAEDQAGFRGNAGSAAGAGANHAAGEAAKHAGEASKAEAEGDPMKAAMEMAMMMAQLAQMAAALAAAKKNKGGEKAAQANPPMATPEVPDPSMKAEAKESPKLDLPQSSDAPTEVAVEPEPAPAPVPEFLAPQLAADHPEEMPAEAIAQNFDSEIPDSIPNREKLGYDENGDGTKPNSGRSSSSSELSLASGLKDDRLYIPLDPESKGRKAKGDKGHEEGSGGGGSEGSESSTPARTDFASMLSAALGKGEGPLVSGLGSTEFSNGTRAGGKNKSPHREIADVGDLNIFQYASARYQQLAKQNEVKKRGLLAITPAERERLIAEFSTGRFLSR